MINKNRTLIFELLGQLAKSKTITLNALIIGVAVVGLKFYGIELTPAETETAMAAVAVLLGLVNIVLRFFTNKPLMEKENLME